MSPMDSKQTRKGCPFSHLAEGASLFRLIGFECRIRTLLRVSAQIALSQRDNAALAEPAVADPDQQEQRQADIGDEDAVPVDTFPREGPEILPEHGNKT